MQGNGQATLLWTGGANSNILELDRFSTGAPFDMYWVIDGVKFMNSTRSGLRLNWVNYVTVKNVESGYNLVWGIFTDFSNYLTFTNIDCHHSEQQHGLYVSNTCGNEIIEDSKFHDNGGVGIHHNGDASQGAGQPGYTTGQIVNSTIRNNLIYNNGRLGGAAINLDGVSQSFIYNNVIFNNFAGGIVSFAFDGVNPGSNTIIHNTVYFSDPLGRYGIALHDGSNNNVVGNNILITANGIHYAIDVEGAGTGNNIDYNAVYVPNGNNQTFTDGTNVFTPEEWAAAGYGSHTVLLPDPTTLFTAVATNDYSEVPGGPTVFQGNIAFSSIQGTVVPDILGVARYAGKVDMGAYQIPTGSNSNSGGSSSSPASRSISFLKDILA